MGYEFIIIFINCSSQIASPPLLVLERRNVILEMSTMANWGSQDKPRVVIVERENLKVLKLEKRNMGNSVQKGGIKKIVLLKN